MKPTEQNALELTNKLVADFSDLLKGYLSKMGLRVVPVMSLKPVTSWTKALTINELIVIGDKELGNEIVYPKGLRTRSRKKEIVMMRQVIAHIASSLGYGSSSIGKALGIDHATVLYGRDTVDNCIQTGDRSMIDLYSKTQYAVNNYYIEKYGEDISKAGK